MSRTPKIIANFLMNDLQGMLKKKKISISDCPITPETIGFLAARVEDGSLTKIQMRTLVKKWIDEYE